MQHWQIQKPHTNQLLGPGSSVLPTPSLICMWDIVNSKSAVFYRDLYRPGQAFGPSNSHFLHMKIIEAVLNVRGNCKQLPELKDHPSEKEKSREAKSRLDLVCSGSSCHANHTHMNIPVTPMWVRNAQAVCPAPPHSHWASRERTHTGNAQGQTQTVLTLDEGLTPLCTDQHKVHFMVTNLQTAGASCWVAGTHDLLLTLQQQPSSRSIPVWGLQLLTWQPGHSSQH